MELLNMLGLTIWQFLVLFFFLSLLIFIILDFICSIFNAISFHIGYKKLNQKLDELSDLYGVFEI